MELLQIIQAFYNTPAFQFTKLQPAILPASTLSLILTNYLLHSDLLAASRHPPPHLLPIYGIAAV